MRDKNPQLWRISIFLGSKPVFYPEILYCVKCKLEMTNLYLWKKPFYEKLLYAWKTWDPNVYVRAKLLIGMYKNTLYPNTIITKICAILIGIIKVIAVFYNAIALCLFTSYMLYIFFFLFFFLILFVKESFEYWNLSQSQ